MTFKSLKFYKNCNTLEAQGVIHENKVAEILYIDLDHLQNLHPSKIMYTVCISYTF